ncbi:MAG: hypothetical protein JXB14_05755 [Candidatus Altiarchaeota archaeon]|nr:hypothetical protein [Candidatus Altiarchaeota archaeon]
MEGIGKKAPYGRLESNADFVEMRNVRVVYLTSSLKIKEGRTVRNVLYELAMIYVPKKTEALMA